MRRDVPWSLRLRKMNAETPTTNMARVASMNGAPSIAPIPMRAPSSDPLPVRTGPRMATTAIMLSGKAVPTAASRLPTAPWRIPRRPPRISIAFVKKAAPKRIATSATTNTTVVTKTHLLSDGPRNAKERAIAACLPVDGLARCASAPVTGREPRSVLTTGPPAKAGGYSPIACDSTRQTLYRQRNRDLVLRRAVRRAEEKITYRQTATWRGASVSPKPVILDVDPGHDDAVALMLGPVGFHGRVGRAVRGPRLQLGKPPDTEEARRPTRGRGRRRKLCSVC